MTTYPIHFIQTADRNYFPMLDITSRTVSAYCLEHDFTFDMLLGICRGYYPWHATFNRIDMLGRIVIRDYAGWVCYLDADAMIVDQFFDLRDWLTDKEDKALIVACGGPNGAWWNVNAGVFFLNFGHPLGRRIAAEWQRLFYEISDDNLRNAKEWSDVPDDQTLLWRVLQSIEGAEQQTLVLYPPHIINYDGSFIKQILRVAGNFERRVMLAEREVLKVLGTENFRHAEMRADAIITEHITAAYNALLLRDADDAGLSYIRAAIKNGLPLRIHLENMINSPEFRSKIQKFLEKYMLQPVSVR